MRIKNLAKTLILSVSISLAMPMLGDDAVGNWNVIPRPECVTTDAGASGFVLDGNVTVVYPAGNKKLAKVAELLSEYVKQTLGIGLNVASTKGSGRNIVLSLAPSNGKEGAYSIKSQSGEIAITAGEEVGVFYGVQTLQKALPECATNGAATLPAADINDAPRFKYRGFLIDVGRHFFPIDYLKKMIDVMALHNMNYFHLHLTEDQGWRIEIKKYPKLTEIGSKRNATLINFDPKIYEEKPYEGYYTQEELKDLVRYAQDRFVTIIPEIDFPGHMLAALASYPEYGCKGEGYEVPTEYGVFADVVCAGNPKSYKFIKDILGEVMAIFPSQYIHIGGDECPKDRWKECPKCQAMIKKLKLEDTPEHSKEDQLQNYFMAQINNFLMQKGRKMLGWDEIVDGGLFPDCSIISWRSTKGGIEAAKQHHDVIMSPIQYLYFSNPGWNRLKGIASVKRVYTFNPVPNEIPEADRKYVIGAQGCIWTEWVREGSKLEWETFPRMAALAELQWTESKNMDFDNFLSRLPNMLSVYDKLGLNYRKDIDEVYIETTALEGGEYEVKMQTYDGAPIFFTTDSMDPTANSLRYTGPLKVATKPNIRAAALRNGKLTPITTAVYGK